MVNRTLTKLTITLLIGAFLVYLGTQYLRNRLAHDAAVQNIKRQDISITIVEGKRREEVAKQLSDLGITSYTDFLQASAGKEGYLFPDTYRFFPNTPATEVVTKMVDDFNLRTKDLHPTNNNVILASIIEREAQNDSERADISGVYTNRLNIGMRLEADPTVQYGKDSLAYNASTNPKLYTFWSAITQADYQDVASPFNTYLHNGLPPTPIANPGLSSIEAAIHPAQISYLYFAHRNGQLLLANTLSEHNAQLKEFARPTPTP